jgi:excisionase family DNA binding protein
MRDESRPVAKFLHDFALPTAFPYGKRRFRVPEGAVMRLPVENDSVPCEVPEPPATSPGAQKRQLLLRVSEAADVLGICRSKVYELLYAGTLPSVKLGSSRRIKYSDLETFVRDLVEEA